MTQIEQVRIKNLVKVLSRVLSSPDSYQDIETALTEMESCMKLLFPKFDLTNTQSRLPSSPAAPKHPSTDEEPCCSRVLVDYGGETAIQESQGGTQCVDGKRAKDEAMTEQEGRRHTKEAGEKKGEEEEEEEEEGHNEDEYDCFIRSSGLVSHSYSLNLNINRGGFSD